RCGRCPHHSSPGGWVSEECCETDQPSRATSDPSYRARNCPSDTMVRRHLAVAVQSLPDWAPRRPQHREQRRDRDWDESCAGHSPCIVTVRGAPNCAASERRSNRGPLQESLGAMTTTSIC